MALHIYTTQRDLYAERDILDLTTLTNVSRAFLCDEHTACPTGPGAGPRDRDRYLAFPQCSYRAQRLTWRTVLARSRLVIVCSCPPGRLTWRRYVLADVFGKLGACLGGELRRTDLHARVTLSSRRHGTS
jgi:hypothetical protein